MILSNNKRFCQRLSNVSCSSSGGTINFLIEPEIELQAQVPRPPIQSEKNWTDFEAILVGRQSQIKRVTLRATLGDRNQRLTVVGKGSLRGPGSIKFRRFPSDCSIKRHPAGIPLCNRVQMELGACNVRISFCTEQHLAVTGIL